MSMRNRNNIILAAIFLLLAAGNVLLGIKYFAVARELRQAQDIMQTHKINDRVVEFTKLFIERVLKAESEVDFETRLQLENAVRGLEDETILARWSEFVESKTETAAQEGAKNLLEALVDKIKVE